MGSTKYEKSQLKMRQVNYKKYFCAIHDLAFIQFQFGSKALTLIESQSEDKVNEPFELMSTESWWSEQIRSWIIICVSLNSTLTPYLLHSNIYAFKNGDTLMLHLNDSHVFL